MFSEYLEKLTCSVNSVIVGYFLYSVTLLRSSGILSYYILYNSTIAFSLHFIKHEESWKNFSFLYVGENYSKKQVKNEYCVVVVKNNLLNFSI